MSGNICAATNSPSPCSKATTTLSTNPAPLGASSPTTPSALPQSHPEPGRRSFLEAVGITSVIVDRSASVHNGGVGALAHGAGAFLSLTGSTIGFNTTGIYFVGGGAAYSYGNNVVNGNINPGLTPTV